MSKHVYTEYSDADNIVSKKNKKTKTKTKKSNPVMPPWTQEPLEPVIKPMEHVNKPVVEEPEIKPMDQPVIKAKRPLPKPIPRKPKPLPEPEPVPEPKKRQHTKPMPRTRKPRLETIPEPVLFPQPIQPRIKPMPRTRKANANKANKTIRKPFNLLASVEPWRPRKTQRQKHAFFKANATEANATEANATEATETKGQANAWVHPLLKQSLKARKAARTVTLG